MSVAQGIAHPRRLGLASHVGLWLERPCLGCAKSRLFGRAGEVGPKAGSVAPLKDQGEVVGGEARAAICEVELELKSGPPSALFALARELSQAAPLQLSFESKAARGQALVAGAAGQPRRSLPVLLDGAQAVPRHPADDPATSDGDQRGRPIPQRDGITRRVGARQWRRSGKRRRVGSLHQVHARPGR